MMVTYNVADQKMIGTKITVRAKYISTVNGLDSREQPLTIAVTSHGRNMPLKLN